MDLQSLASEMDTVQERSLQCQFCERDINFTNAAMFCETCNVYLCSECYEMHVRLTFGESHIITIAELDSKKAPKVNIPAQFVTRNTPRVDMHSIDRCPKHDELLKFLCTGDGKLCCGTCAFVEHRKCKNVMEIKTAAENNKGRFCIDISQLSQISDKNNSIMHCLKSTERKLSRQIENLPKTLDGMYTQLNDWFKKCSSRAVKLANDQTNEKITQIQQRHLKCESLAKSISKTLEIHANILRNGTLDQQFIAQHKLNIQMRDYQNIICELSSTIETVKLIPNFSDPISNLFQLGSNIVIVENRTVSIDKMPDFRSIELKLITSLDVKQSDNDAEVPLYTGMDYLLDGRLVVADNFNEKLLIMNEKLETICTLTLGYHPLSVVAISKDCFAVTSAQKTVNIYSANTSNENPHLQLKETMKTQSEFDSICIKNDRCFVVSTIDNPKPALMLSRNGVETQFNVSLPKKQYTIETSACTYMKRSEKLILSDRDDDTLYIIDVKNNTTISVKNETIKEPRGLVCGPNETILVCCADTNSLVQLSSIGKILSSHKLDMFYPCTVCISADMTKLAVAGFTDTAGKLHVYSIKSK